MNVVREAKLFEAAKFPERGIDFTEADLDAIIASFKPVPVKVQHTTTPFDGKMGEVLKIWRKGKELMGQISFPEKVWAFLEHMGTKKLSVGLDYRQRRLQEVSIVQNPRVLTARVFSDSVVPELVCFEDNFNEGGSTNMSAEFSAEFQATIAAAEARGAERGRTEALNTLDEKTKGVYAENERLRRENAETATSVILAGWKAEGKMPPACEKYAKAILIDGLNLVTFSDGANMTAAEAFTQFMAYMVPMVSMGGKTEEKTEEFSVSAEGEKVLSGLGLTAEDIKDID